MRLTIYAKTADSFSMNSSYGTDYYGYPPVRKGISRDGDSIEMTVDNETGQIVGWVPFTKEELDAL